MQELFVRLSSAGLAQAQHPAAYARRVAINLAMDWRRARKHQVSQEIETAIASQAAPEIALERADDVARILDAAQELTEIVRQAFVLRYVQQDSYESVGKAIGKTPHQARALCHLAVRTIRQQLAPKEVSRERVE